MSVQEHIERLHALREAPNWTDAAHEVADAILLDIIDELAPTPAVAKLIRATYAAVPRWYS